MKLCVGCGNMPEGNVNVDAFPLDRTQCAFEWKPKETVNFVLADATHLPFRNKVFSAVVARHCLEHIPAPLEALKEWSRVCKGKVQVYVPSQYIYTRTRTHIYAWTPYELTNLLKLVFPKVYVNYTERGVLNNLLYKRKLKFMVAQILIRLFGFYREIYGEGQT